MTNKDIERIIREGTIKQKIKLYMTDTALFNLSYSRDNSILTDRDRDLIWKSIKEPKDIKYYEDLRTSNKIFIMFKEHLASYYKRIYFLSMQCKNCIDLYLLHSFYEEVINDLIEVAPDKKTRDTLLKTAIEKTKKYNGKKYQEKGFDAWLDITDSNKLSDFAINIEMIAEEIITVKTFFETIKQFLNKWLPIRPYIDYLNENEKKIIELLDNVKILQDIHKDSLPNDMKKVIPYKDINVEVTKESLENIKNAGL
jgi:hypothetical protein